MNKRDILAFLEGWPPGHQLNMYLDNGFNVVCTKRCQIESVTADLISGHDFMGRPFLLPIEHLTLFTFRLEGKPDNKKGQNK